MNTKHVSIVVLVVIALGLFYYFSQTNNSSNSETTTSVEKRDQEDLIKGITNIEDVLGENARVGLSVVNSDADIILQHRGDERFPMTSTFKTLACGVVLQKVDAGEESLDREMLIGEEDMVPYAPVTENHVGGLLTLGELCEAAITTSDNVAGNKILETLGGPEGFTALLRSVGDIQTRLDRWEVELNEAAPDDPRDTTTPNQMSETLHTFLTGNTLSDESKKQLSDWLYAQAVADSLFRSRLPSGWQIADKSGGGGFGSRSIAAMLKLPEGEAFFVSLYITNTEKEMADLNVVVADIGEMLFEFFSGSEDLTEADAK
ncbi:MAG: class A beta-lactamase [Candidatus Nomurabacteria bacterium]|nr:class A beta-lactamase [Candidatus Nomurabacteria bacterium]USN88286.1 MAG: class A beta-lactamase [Candidatus Nomurabacteria bacterium]